MSLPLKLPGQLQQIENNLLHARLMIPVSIIKQHGLPIKGLAHLQKKSPERAASADLPQLTSHPFAVVIHVQWCQLSASPGTAACQGDNYVLIAWQQLSDRETDIQMNFKISNLHPPFGTWDVDLELRSTSC